MKPLTFLLLALILGFVVAEVSAQDDPKTHARAALERFMTEWNSGDDARLRTAMHFPFVNFFGGDRVSVVRDPETFTQGFE